MAEKNYIVGTAGHIDHGKSTLIEALTGVDPDRLPEEKARGMTIDLGFAHLELEDPTGSGAPYQLGLIDVPGHADFVKNMVAGVGSVDVALFVVAADDGWMPQSEEHLEILSYLGVARAVVALTKVDTVDDPAERVAEISLQLEGTAFEGATVVPVCALIGDGIEDLKEALATALAETPAPRDIGKPRLSVDRVFSPQGIGTVVTGTLNGGRFKKGATAMVQPYAQKASLRNVQSHSENRDEVVPGTRTALNLPELAIRKGRSREGVRRGDVVTIGGLGEAAQILHVSVEKSQRGAGNKGSSAHRPVKHAQRVRLHHGSASVGARVMFFENSDLEAGGRMIAELRLDEPVYAMAGDRFVLRDWSKRFTLCGGSVLDPTPPDGSYRGESQRVFLEARAKNPLDAAVLVTSLIARDQVVVEGGDLLAQSQLSVIEIKAAVATASEAGALMRIGTRLFDVSAWQALADGVGAKVDAIHASNPELPGLPLNDLRATMKSQLPEAKLFDVLIDHLCANGYARAGTAIRSQKHLPQLPPNLKAAGEALRKTLAANPLEPPNPKDLTPNQDASTALKFFIETGQAVHLSDKAIILASAYDDARMKVRAHIEANGPATAAALRDVLGTTRRVLIPLLEMFDRNGVTARQGDFRILR
ncbi:MAG: selenocysteine-specific elongation factor [Verrucomicrobiales bacterium]|jgi:selenocysteine-specific elongation factor